MWCIQALTSLSAMLQMHVYTRLLGASPEPASQGAAKAPYSRYLYKLEESGTQISPTVHGLLPT